MRIKAVANARLEVSNNEGFLFVAASEVVAKRGSILDPTLKRTEEMIIPLGKAVLPSTIWDVYLKLYDSRVIGVISATYPSTCFLRCPTFSTS